MGWRRAASTTLVALVGFFDHVEYAIVVPSLYLYLETLGLTSEWIYSLVFAAFSFAVFVVAPLAGAYVDRYPMKPVILLGLLVSVGGQFLYAIAWDVYVVVLSRLVVGIGAATMSILMVYVTRITTADERTSLMARFQLIAQTGLLLGPAFAILFEQLDFYIGPWNVNKYTAPGWLMMVQNGVLFVLMLVFFLEPERAGDVDREGGEGKREDSGYGEGEAEAETETEAGAGESAETDPFAGMSWFQRVYHMVTPAVATVFCLQFIFGFVQMSMETVLPPLTDYYYEFSALKNSILYCLIVVVFVAVFLLIMRIAPRVQDRTMIVIGLCFEVFSLTATVVLLVAFDPPPLWLFLTVMVVFAAGLPFFFTCIASLLTKLVRAEAIGTAQGLLVSTMTIAQILGPMWAGSFSIEPWVPFVGDLALILVLVVVFAVMFKSLYVSRPADAVDGGADERADGMDEETPLIN